MTGRPLVVVSGTAHWTSMRLAEHHVARQLARSADVLFVDPPLSRLTVRRRPELAHHLEPPRLREVATGIHVLQPLVVPGKDRPVLTHLADMQVRRAIRRAVASLGARRHATVLTLPQRQLFERRGAGRTVYWAKDDHVAGAALYGLDAGRLERSERRLARRADHVVVVSDALAATWRRRGMHATPQVVPNGCDLELLAQSADTPTPSDLDLQRGYAVFVGTLSDRIDADLLLAVADRGVDVLLVGGPRATAPWPALDRLRDHPGVHLVGPQPYEQLPAYLGAATVGLVPYRHDPYNQGSFPLKILEYLAAGLPVVATGLPAARWLGADNVHVEDEAVAFADRVVDLIAAAADPARAASCRADAQPHGWGERAARFAALLDLPAD